MDTDRAADMRRHLGDRGLNGQRGMRRAFGIVVMGNRRTEDGHHAVADVPDDVSVMLLNDPVGAVVELLEQGVNLLGVELLTESRGAGEVREQHRHLPPFADRLHRRCGRCPPAFRLVGGLHGGAAQRRDGIEQFAAMADQTDTEFFEILGGERR